MFFLYLHQQQLIISCLYTYNNLYEQRGKTYLLVNSSTSKKNFFSFLALTPSQSAWKPCVYRGFSGEGKCEGKLSPLTLALTPRSVLKSHLSCQGTIRIKRKSKYKSKEIIKKRIRVKDSVASVIVRERFLI